MNVREPPPHSRHSRYLDGRNRPISREVGPRDHDVCRDSDTRQTSLAETRRRIVHPTSFLSTRIGEFSHPGSRWRKPLATPAVPSGHSLQPHPRDTQPSGPSTPQLCPVACCPSRHGKEARTGPRNKASRTTSRCTPPGFSRARVQNKWLAERSRHICLVCFRLFSHMDQTGLSQTSPGLSTIPPRISSNNPGAPTRQTWTKFSPPACRSGLTSRRPPKKRRSAATTPGLDRPPVPPEGCPPLGTREGKQNNKRSSNDMRTLWEQWLEGARGAL